MSGAPTLGQVKAELALVLEREPDCRLVAWRCAEPYREAVQIEVEGRRFEVVSPRSPLEFHRLALQAERGERRLACLVALDEHDLSLDLLRRLPRGRLLRLDAWSAVRQRFKAREIDPWLQREPELAATLLESEPPEGFTPALGGVLTAEHAWSYLLPLAFGLPPDSTDPVRLMRFSQGEDPGTLSRVEPGAQESLKRWLGHRLGEAAGFFLAVLRRAPRDLVPLGLVCEALFAPEAIGSAAQAAAAARLEPLVEGQRLSPSVAGVWTRSALVALDAEEDSGESVWPRVVQRATRLMEELGAASLLHFSSVLPLGFERRLGELAASLDEDHLRPVLRHRQAQLEPERAERARMAVRLARWLKAPSKPGRPELEAQLSWYLAEGLFLDRARSSVYQGDPQPELGEICRRLFQAARQEREKINESFARALQGWHEAGAPDPVLGVEGFLGQILAPLVRQTRVLLIVLDGCSLAILSQLLEDAPGLGLATYRHERAPALIAALPSVTEFSRASLLAGRLTQGDSESEKRDLGAHSGVRAACRKDHPPRLFHRAEVLDPEGGLQPELVRRLETEQPKLVGVVLNAVDDWLARDDQLAFPWRLAAIGPLAALLTTARRTERAVVLVSDHGHLLEQGTRLEAAGEGGERWSPATGEPGPGWMDFSGPRVLQGTVRLPYSETVRLGVRKNGYHGGATPQETVCLLRVLAPPGRRLKGWSEMPEGRPAWWSPPAPQVKASPAPTPPPTSGQLDLFEAAAPPPSLVARLLDSALFRQQCRSRSVSITQLAPLEALLEALLRLEPPVPVRLLSQVLEVAETSLREQLSRAAALLNLDAYPVLSVEGQQLTLDRARLESLFELGPAGETPLVVVGRSGRRSELRLPFAVNTQERRLLGELARRGRVTETEARQLLGTRRAGGLLADLATRLHQAGWTHLSAEPPGQEGMVYRLSL